MAVRRRRRVAPIALVVALAGAGSVLSSASAQRDVAARTIAETPGDPLPPGARAVALTFDDAPNPEWTPKVLDVLASRGVPATFFVIGRQAVRYPDLIRRAVSDGHAVANHTWSHANLTRLDDSGFGREVDTTSHAITDITGVTPRCLRPPGGAATAATAARSRARGLTLTEWTVDPTDWRRPPADVITDRVLHDARPGAVILLHDGGGPRGNTLAALPRIIDGLRDRGYTFVSICGGRPAFVGASIDGPSLPPVSMTSRSRFAGIATTGATTGAWVTAADGAVFTAGAAPYLGGTNGRPLNAPVVDIAAHGDDGYWLAAADGGVFSFGSAPFHGSLGGSPAAPVVAVSSAPDGDGYWLYGRDGGVFSFGSAPFTGSAAGVESAPVVDGAVTPSGRGHWIVGADGSVITIGDAGYYGRTASAVSIAPTRTGRGYWIVTAGGGVVPFGDAAAVAVPAGQAAARTVGLAAARDGVAVLRERPVRPGG